MPEVRMTLAKLGKDTSIYAVVFGLQRIVGFALLPVYTRYLRPSDYGVMQLLDMTVDLGAILFTAGMSSGVQRLMIRTTSEVVRARVVSTAFIVEVVLSALGSALMFALAPLIFAMSRGGVGSVELVRIAALNFSLSMLLAVPMVVMQTQQRSGMVLLVSAAKLVLQVSLNLWMLAVEGAGVRGILLSTLVANLIVGGGLTLWLLRRVGTGVDRAILGELARFGLPIQVMTAGSFVLAFGDRFFLLPLHGTWEIGVYGLTCQFGFLLGQLSGQPFLSAWNPLRYQLSLLPRAVRDSRYQQGFLFFNLFLITAATGIGLFGRPLLQIMTQVDYHAAAQLIPLVVFAYIFQWWMYAVAFGLEVSGKTTHLASSSWASVIVALLLYMLLIPGLGAAGAALASLFTFVFRFLVVYRAAQRAWPITYHWRPILRLLTLSAAVVCAAMLSASGSILGDTLGGVGWFALYAVAVVYAVLDGGQRAAVFRAAQSPRAAIARLIGEN